MRRLAVFPSDPIAAYVEKGEIKRGYYNPGALFDEIHVLSRDKGPVDEGALRTLAEPARVVLHPLGDWNLLSPTRSPYVGAYARRATALVRVVAPDVIRAFSPQEDGWLARTSARATSIPYVVSVHGNYDLDIRERLLKTRRWRGYAYYLLTRLFVEPRVLRGAAAVICAYEFAAAYVRRMRTDVHVIYNRVYLDQFRPATRTGAFTTLFVGRFQENKGQELLIRAMRYAPGRLVLVGDGPTRAAAEKLAESLGLGDRIEFVRAVPNAEMPAVYARASCFASAIVYGGIQIPHLEAMASGLPLVVAGPTWEDQPEQMGDVALVPERTPEAIAAALRRVADDRTLADALAARSLARAAELNGDRMEARERALYEAVVARARGAA